MNAKYVRWLCAAMLPLVTGGWMGAAAAAAADGARYSYLDASYVWADTVYAMSQDGSSFDGVNLEGSLGVLPWLHVFGDYFNGNLTGGGVNKNATAYSLGAGVSYPLTKIINLEANAAWARAELENFSDDGYMVEGKARMTISDNAEVSIANQYTNISGSNISNNDVIVGLQYNVTDQFSVRATGVVFDSNPGFSLGVRWYFGKLMGRDSLF